MVKRFRSGLVGIPPRETNVTINPFAPQQPTPIGWTRGETIRLQQYTPTIKFVRKFANPFRDKPCTAATLEFTDVGKANEWLRWWFADTKPW